MVRAVLLDPTNIMCNCMYAAIFVYAWFVL